MTAAFYGLCVALMLVMRLAPDSGLGRWLNRCLVAEPLALVARIERHHLIFVIVVAVMALAAGEVLAIYGPLASAAAMDISIYLDVTAVTIALATVARLRSALQSVQVKLAGLPVPRRAARRRRTRAAGKRPGKSANDDDPAFGFHLAAA